MRPSVVQIRVGDPMDRAGRVIGTGFLVHRDGYALTARHVTDHALSIQKQSPKTRLLAGLAIPNFESLQLTIRASFELVEITVVEQDERHDLALLRLTPNPFATGKPSGISVTEKGIAVNALYGLAQTEAARPRDGDATRCQGQLPRGRCRKSWQQRRTRLLDLQRHGDGRLRGIPSCVRGAHHRKCVFLQLRPVGVVPIGYGLALLRRHLEGAASSSDA